MEVVLGVSGGILGTVILNQIKNVVSNRLFAWGKYRLLKRNLKKSINDLNYEDFKNIIYEIKNMDVRYQTDYYIQSKTDFYFNDNILRNKKIFDIKYNPNYNFEEEREHSYSYSRRYSQFFS